MSINELFSILVTYFCNRVCSSTLSIPPLLIFYSSTFALLRFLSSSTPLFLFYTSSSYLPLLSPSVLFLFNSIHSPSSRTPPHISYSSPRLLLASSPTPLLLSSSSALHLSRRHSSSSTSPSSSLHLFILEIVCGVGRHLAALGAVTL